MQANDQTMPAPETASAPVDTPAATTASSDSLLTPIDTTDATPKTDEPVTPETPDWFMKDKFKTIDDQARSYKDLVGKMGKFWGSPEGEYTPDGIEGLEAGDPLVSALTPALKELGVSQDGFAHLVNAYMAGNREMLKGFEDELRQTLTTKDAHAYQAVDKWMNDNLTKEESMLVKNNWLMTPEDFHLFNNLRLMAAPSTNVPNTGNAGATFESTDSVTNEKIKYKKEVKEGIRVKDKNFEDQLSSRLRDAAAREIRAKGR